MHAELLNKIMLFEFEYHSNSEREKSLHESNLIIFFKKMKILRLGLTLANLKVILLKKVAYFQVFF